MRGEEWGGGGGVGEKDEGGVEEMDEGGVGGKLERERRGEGIRGEWGGRRREEGERNMYSTCIIIVSTHLLIMGWAFNVILLNTVHLIYISISSDRV